MSAAFTERDSLRALLATAVAERDAAREDEASVAATLATIQSEKSALIIERGVLREQIERLSMRPTTSTQLHCEELRTALATATARAEAAEKANVEWLRAAQETSDLFDPMKAKTSPSILTWVCKAAKEAHLSVRAERDALFEEHAKQHDEERPIRTEVRLLKSDVATLEAQRDQAAAAERVLVADWLRRAGLANLADAVTAGHHAAQAKREG